MPKQLTRAELAARLERAEAVAEKHRELTENLRRRLDRAGTALDELEQVNDANRRQLTRIAGVIESGLFAMHDAPPAPAAAEWNGSEYVKQESNADVRLLQHLYELATHRPAR